MKKLLRESDNVTVQRQNVELPLLKTTLNDPHVKRLIDHATGGDPDKAKGLLLEIEHRLEKIKCVADISPLLYEAAADNMIETVIFNKFWHKPAPIEAHIKKAIKDAMGGGDGDIELPEKPKAERDAHDEELDKMADEFAKLFGKEEKAARPEKAPKFDHVVFSKLVNKIKAESKSFFPLRNMIDFHVIHHPEIKIVGDGLNEKNERRFGDVDTAAATADGTFIFNIHFCQALLDFAHVKQLVPKDTRYGKKYVANGGDIPNEYEYLEFLIRHEFMHYTYSDFHYQKVIPDASAKLINWVGDFRTNHRLVQQGFTQLPMGLFSSYINFHRQRSYSEMYNLVRSEFAKLKDKCKGELEEELNSNMDHHGENGKTTDGGDKEVDREMKPGEVDKWNEKTNDKAEAEDGEPPPDYKNKPPEQRDPGHAKGGRHEIDYSSISPKYKWDALLKKMVGETAYVMDQSYQKISRRAIGTMQQVITRGRGAVKPGDVKNPSKKKIKLAVIIDSSGSMSYVIHTVMSNLDKLLVQRQGITGVHDEFYMFIFSGDYDIYECTPGKSGTAQHIMDVDGHKPGPLGKLKLPEVLAAHKSGGTVFSSDLAGQIKKLASRGYNCLVVSDGDMLHGQNYTNFKELYASNRKHVWLLLDSKETFAQFCAQMKEISNNASHL